MTASNLYTRQPTEIVMYSVDWCPDCKRAKFFFKRNNINVVEVNVDNDEQGAAFVREINSGTRSVPTIIFPDGSIMVEPSTEELAEKFSKS
ncbi:MAG: NrdH-redoxin [Chloroflexi bacterium]|nr:NrdH-redoxin [Chloroflexota bacterium]